MKEHFIKFIPGNLRPQYLTASIADTEALLRFLYREIGCSSIENVWTDLRSGKDRIIMVVDEEGLLKDQPEPNITGCAIYNGTIVGNLIIGREVIRDGEPDFGGFETVVDAIEIAAQIESRTLRAVRSRWK